MSMIYTVNVTLETRDPELARVLAGQMAECAFLAAKNNSAVHRHAVDVDSYREGQLQIPEAVIEEIVRRVRGEEPRPIEPEAAELVGEEAPE